MHNFVCAIMICRIGVTAIFGDKRLIQSTVTIYWTFTYQEKPAKSW